MKAYGRIGAAVTYSKSVSRALGRSQGMSRSIQRTSNATINVPPRTSLVARLQTWQVTGRVPFKSTVTFDGTLVKNDRNWTRLSDALPIEQRTFPVEGILEIKDGSAGETVYLEAKFNATKCSNASTIVTTPHTPSTSPLKRIDAKALSKHDR
jgi:hypothetical protein